MDDLESIIREMSIEKLYPRVNMKLLHVDITSVECVHVINHECVVSMKRGVHVRAEKKRSFKEMCSRPQEDRRGR